MWWEDADEAGIDRFAALDGLRKGPWGMRRGRSSRGRRRQGGGAQDGAFRGPFPPGPLPHGGGGGRARRRRAAGGQEWPGRPNRPGRRGRRPVRMREYFPETLLWQPNLITDDQGRAEMPLTFADSHHHLAAHGLRLLQGRRPRRRHHAARASSRTSSRTSTCPFCSTEHDHVRVPRRRLQLPADAPEGDADAEAGALVPVEGSAQESISIDAGQVKVVTLSRSSPDVIGHHALEVTARGSKLSDALPRRQIEVNSGRAKEETRQPPVNDRLEKKADKTVVAAGKRDQGRQRCSYVKLYPGTFSQIVEGLDGILRMPGGCFEQTTARPPTPTFWCSTTSRRRSTSKPPELQAQGRAVYQRRLPAAPSLSSAKSGFDWWGQESNEPLIWVSAYGLQEFNDMAKVYPVDHGVIDRTQAWLMKQQAADGTWSNIGATARGVHLVHGQSESPDELRDLVGAGQHAARQGLDQDGGTRSAEEGHRVHPRGSAEGPGRRNILALSANALASWDAKDDSTHAVLKRLLVKLEDRKQAKPEWRAISFPAQGQSLSYARDESLTVETTALATLAMLKHGGFTNRVNRRG